MTEKLELSKDEILKGLGNKLMPESAKEKLLNMLIELEIKGKVGKPGYDTLTSYYGRGEGLNYISNYVRSLVQNEGFGVGSGIAQFDSNF
jgi:hypothetical protein